MTRPGTNPSAVRRSRVVSLLTLIRGNSHSGFYVLAGAFGGIVGAALASLAAIIALPALRATETSALSESSAAVLATGTFFGVLAAALSTALLLGMKWYHRQRMRWASTLVFASANLFAGALAGAACQLIFNGFTDSPVEGHPIVVTAAFALVGTLLGVTLSRCVPNLQHLRGLSAGLVAGVFSGLSTATLAGLGFTAPAFHLAGCVVLGSVLGAAIAFAERHFRDAVLEINWDAGQTTRVGLGPEPVTIGGGKDHITIPGAPAHVSSVALRNGRIEHVEKSNGKRTPLKDGSRLRIGGLVMVVHSNQSPNNQ